MSPTSWGWTLGKKGKMYMYIVTIWNKNIACNEQSRSKIWGNLKEGETMFTCGSIRVKRFQWTKYSWPLNNGVFNCMDLLTHGFFSPNTYYSTTESHSWLNLWSQNQRFGRLTVELYADFLQKGGSAPLTPPPTLHPNTRGSRVNCTSIFCPDRKSVV